MLEDALVAYALFEQGLVKKVLIRDFLEEVKGKYNEAIRVLVY